MDEFEALASLVFEEMREKSEEEQKEILRAAIAAERYRTLNDVQMEFSNTRTAIEALLPSEFYDTDKRFRFRFISTAELNKRRNPQ